MFKKISVIFVLIAMLVSLTACDSLDYKKAMGLYEDEAWEDALVIFEGLGDYEDSAEMVNACKYEIACDYFESGAYQNAADAFTALGSYKDSAEKAIESGEMAVHAILAGKWSYTISANDVSITMTIEFNYGELSASISSSSGSIPANEGDYTLDLETKTINVNYDNGNSTSFTYSFEGGVYTITSGTLVLTKE